MYRLILVACQIFALTSSVSCQSDNVDGVIVNKTVPILETDNLLLRCNTSFLENVDGFYWIRNNTATKASTFVAWGWKLEIYVIKRDQKGLYICNAVDNSTGFDVNVTLNIVNVDVQYAAEIERFTLSPSNITENETFDVSCAVHGNPAPDWGIFNRDTGRAILLAQISGGTTLGGNPVKCGYSGKWVCSGYNRLNNGVNVTRGVHLIVRCPPRPDPLPTKFITTYSYLSPGRDDVSMTLNITADPVPTYTWSRDDERKFGNVTVKRRTHGSTLRIHDVDVNDFGNYTLTMNNSMGSYDAHFVLKAYGYPEKPSNVSASNITYDSAVVTWTSGYDFGSRLKFKIGKYEWYRSGIITITEEITGPYKNGGVSQHWTYLLRGLNGSTEYKMAVMAGNAENWTTSEPFKFSTPAAPVHVETSDRTAAMISIYVFSGFVVLAVSCVTALLLISRHRGQKLTLNGVKEILTNEKSHRRTIIVKQEHKTADVK